MNAVDKKFDEWFDKTSFAGKGALGIARMAYEQALIDVWDLPVTDICDVATKHGKVVKADGSVADFLKMTPPQCKCCESGGHYGDKSGGYYGDNMSYGHERPDDIYLHPNVPNGHTAAEFFADPDGYDEYDLKTTVVRPDPRPHCCYHPKYHGERCVQIRKGETQVCEECENVYKQVQAEKERAKLRVALP